MREEENKTSQKSKSKFQRTMKKRWALPAIYIASAAIILSGTLWYQNGSKDSTDSGKNGYEEAGKEKNQPAVEVNSKVENISMPVVNGEEAVIKKDFYDVNAKKEEQEAALLSYNNRFEPNKGIDVAMPDGKTFDVVASLSGTVTNVKEDSLLGNVIEIEHEDGVVTRYQSVQDFAVEIGQNVKQGDVLAKAGQSLINEEAGIHVHFEIRKDNVAVNPLNIMEKPVTALFELEAQPASEEKATEEQTGEEPAQQGTVTEEESAEQGTVTEEEPAEEDAATEEEAEQTEEGSTEEKGSEENKDASTDTTDDADKNADSAEKDGSKETENNQN
ncbi:M23 family peptidase [Peribacillus saganii]|uniref:M23 family peptidase n=1 Tax=Peribacillus saganii TaxID=2303992 RepID=A0A372LKB1_9BACI|nr:M23 family metallopeptidase [Peribacillus saganii]RFU67089.1 M23 family peptidase [Peribacillus saganii]